MNVVDDDSLVLSTGTVISRWTTIVGIGCGEYDKNRLYTGHDDYLFNGDFIDLNGFTKEELHEIADFMLEKWKAFKDSI